MHAPRKGRSDRDSSRWDLPGQASKVSATGNRLLATCPWACRGGRNSPAGSHRWPASSSCLCTPVRDPIPSELLTSHCPLSEAIVEFLALHFRNRSSHLRHALNLLCLPSRVLSSFCLPFSTPATTLVCASSIQSNDFVNTRLELRSLTLHPSALLPTARRPVDRPSHRHRKSRDAEIGEASCPRSSHRRL